MKKRKKSYINMGISPSRKKRPRFRTAWFIAGLVIVAVIVLFLTLGPFTRTGSDHSKEITPGDTSDFRALLGEWIRVDGGYVIRLKDIEPDGRVHAVYLNPRSINVSDAFISKQGDRTKLFIKLHDKGYPGSTYTLLYNRDNDALVGIYYQAVMGRSFDVAFLRKR